MVLRFVAPSLWAAAASFEVVKVRRGVIESLTHEAPDPGDVLSHALAIHSEELWLTTFEGNHQCFSNFDVVCDRCGLGRRSISPGWCREFRELPCLILDRACINQCE